MAYSDTIKYVVGDTRPVINIALKDSNTAAAGKTLDSQDSTTWAAISLSGKEYVKMYIRKVGTTFVADSSSSSYDASKVLTASSVVDGDGTAVFTPTTSTFDSAGTYEGEIEVKYTSGDFQTVHELVKFIVRDDFN